VTTPATALAGPPAFWTGDRLAGGRYPGPVRLTVFWDRMNSQFGEHYAASVAQDYVLADIGGRTVNQALADGVPVKNIWGAVCDAFDVPDSLR
jgi:Protein of unknown function (DUF3046)